MREELTMDVLVERGAVFIGEVGEPTAVGRLFQLVETSTAEWANLYFWADAPLGKNNRTRFWLGWNGDRISRNRCSAVLDAIGVLPKIETLLKSPEGQSALQEGNLEMPPKRTPRERAMALLERRETRFVTDLPNGKLYQGRGKSWRFMGWHKLFFVSDEPFVSPDPDSRYERAFFQTAYAPSSGKFSRSKHTQILCEAGFDREILAYLQENSLNHYRGPTKDERTYELAA